MIKPVPENSNGVMGLQSDILIGAKGNPVTPVKTVLNMGEVMENGMILRVTLLCHLYAKSRVSKICSLIEKCSIETKTRR